MKRIALLFALLVAGPAFAADNAVIVTPGVGVTMKSKDIGAGVQSMQPVISDTSGNALSTPTAGADAVSNTSTGLLGYSRGFVFNGTTWDRWLGDATNGGFVNVKTSVLPTGASSAAKQPALGTAGTASVDVLSVQGIASMTPLLATVTGSLTNISGTISLPTGASTAVKQPALGTAGTAAADVISVQGIASMTPLLTTATGAAGTARIGYTSDDPCTQKAKTNLPISQNGTSSVQLVALSGATVIYVCSLSLVAAGATTVALTTGTGTACVTGNAAVLGSTTANIANSLSFAANGGMTMGNGGGTIAAGAASSELCMVLGTNVFVSGNLTYVQQ